MSSILDAFGFHNKWITRNHGMEADSEKRTVYLKHNVTHILGYFPVVGIITGVIRIALANKEMETNKKPENHAGYAVWKARGVFEILGIGAVFLIPDSIISIIRAVGARFRNKNLNAF